ncbi:MAG: hypothetical protein IID31_07300 [Planctomycetes bacterium]|nr:hypothetical protein [Planctomycetota bacterium]
MLAVTFRRFRHFLRNPAVSLPSFAMPLFFLAFGGGGLSSLGNVPAFDFPSGYTAFFFAYVVLQGAAFAGAATGAAIAAEASITPRPMNSRRVYALALCRSMSGFLIGRMNDGRIAHQSVSALCRRIVSTCRAALLSSASFGQHN